MFSQHNPWVHLHFEPKTSGLSTERQCFMSDRNGSDIYGGGQGAHKQSKKEKSVRITQVRFSML